jgi:hypothetical protein
MDVEAQEAEPVSKTGGVFMRKVEVTTHNKQWVSKFEDEADK